MNWDSVIETKKITKEFIGGESLISFKDFVAQLPDELAANMTATLSLELVIHK